MNKKISLQLANIIGFAGTLVVNYLANTLPINNKTTGELAAQYPNLFVPANITFSIWGVIYLLLLAFVIYQARDVFSRNKVHQPFLYRIGWFFFISSLANIGWILAWHYEQVALSLLIMFILLASLVLIYLRLGIGKKADSRPDKYFVHLPFSVYLGWITVATFTNTIALLVKVNARWFLDNEGGWTIAAIILITAITVFILVRRKDIFFSAVILWAFLGIIIKRMNVDPQPVTSLITITAVCWIIIAIGTIMRLRRWFIY